MIPLPTLVEDRIDRKKEKVDDGGNCTRSKVKAQWQRLCPVL